MSKKIDYTRIDCFDLDEHLILLKNNSSTLQLLNPLAKFIWQLSRKGINNIKIAEEISEAFNVSSELAQQDVETLISQWLLDFSSINVTKTVEKIVPRLTQNKVNDLTCSNILLSFSNTNIKVSLDSDIIAKKVRKIFSNVLISDTSTADIYFEVISRSGSYLIVKDNIILEQIETESYAALMIAHYVVDFACKQTNWLTILHAAGVSCQGSSIIFPALGGSGKTTLTAALIKQGFDYINDDTIPLLRNTNELIHLPTSLSVKSGSWSLLQVFYPEIEMLENYGSQEPRIKYLPPPKSTFSSPLLAKCIILPNYQAGAATNLDAISPVFALQAIVAGESLLHLPLKKEDVTALIKWLEPLPCYRLTYDKLNPAVDLLRQFCMEHLNK